MLYGQIQNDEVAELAKQFESAIRIVAPSFVLLEPQAGEIGRFSKLQFNKRGAGFDGQAWLRARASSAFVMCE